MPTHTSDLFLLEDLEAVGKTSELAEHDLVRALAEELRRLPWRVARD